MAMKPSRLVLAALILSSFSCVAAVDVQVPSELPIFDAHIHYSRDAWDALSPDQALDILDRAGVRWALVSSTP
ncbi:MAG: amidohydrolase, partial [candidate division NC10 bacterium]